MNEKYEGLKVTDVDVNAGLKGFVVSWVAPRLGFGELTFWLADDGKLHVDTECMSDAFVSLVLSKLPPFLVVEG